MAKRVYCLEVVHGLVTSYGLALPYYCQLVVLFLSAVMRAPPVRPHITPHDQQYVYHLTIIYCCCLNYSGNYYVHIYEFERFLLLLTVYFSMLLAQACHCRPSVRVIFIANASVRSSYEGFPILTYFIC